VLQPGGRLRVSVPDMDTLCRLFIHPQVKVDGKFQIMRMLFGGRQEAFDVHLSGLNFDFLGNFLTQAWFERIKRVPEFNEFVDDGANFRFLGVPVSCNIEAFKGA
jgi:predicted SAM-dependent methyltransferase